MSRPHFSTIGRTDEHPEFYTEDEPELSDDEILDADIVQYKYWFECEPLLP